jgi:hypothetical protein
LNFYQTGGLASDFTYVLGLVGFLSIVAMLIIGCLDKNYKTEFSRKGVKNTQMDKVDLNLSGVDEHKGFFA